MKVFRYRLQSVLDLRIAERDQLRARLADAYEALNVLQQHTEQIEQELAEAQAEIRHASTPGRLEVDSLLGGHRRQLFLRSQMAALKQQSQQIADEAERRRLAVVEADVRVRALEKLRQRRRDEHRREVGKQEMKRLDDIAQRFNSSREETP